MLSSVYDSYYKDWPQRIIIDRGPFLTEGNMMLMTKYFKHSYKCIVLLRDLMDGLASYIKWYTENVDAFINKLGNTDEEKLTLLMSKDGAIGKNLTAMQKSLNYQHQCCYIKYDDWVTKPKPTIQKIYKLINEQEYHYKIEN